jgi:hypothetical protein
MRHLRWFLVAAAVVAVPQGFAATAQPVAAPAPAMRPTAFLDAEFAEDERRANARVPGQKR